MVTYTGIEPSFRELKYNVGLIVFYSKKKDCVIQETFASLIMYSFSISITENIFIDDDNHNNYCYKINYAIAINACIRFFYSTHADFSALEKLIARNKCLSDPIVFLKEKLVIILPSASITDYHNSFLLLLTFSLLIQKP